MSQRPKGQHVIPRFYLANFTGEKGVVWTYDPLSEAIRSATPENTAKQTNFYSVVDKKEHYRYDIENWLSGVETKASALYQKVLRGEVLRGQERADFAVFVAGLYARSLAHVNLAAEAVGAFAQMRTDMIVADREQFERIMDAMAADTGQTTTSEQREAIFNYARQIPIYRRGNTEGRAHGLRCDGSAY